MGDTLEIIRKTTTSKHALTGDIGSSGSMEGGKSVSSPSSGTLRGLLKRIINVCIHDESPNRLQEKM